MERQVAHRLESSRGQRIGRGVTAVILCLCAMALLAGVVAVAIQVLGAPGPTGSGFPAVPEAPLAEVTSGAAEAPSEPEATAATAVPTPVPTRAPASAMLVTGFLPEVASTSGGEAIVISGEGFVEGVDVVVGGRVAREVEVLGPTTIRAVLPAGPAGPAVVEIFDAEGAVATAEAPLTFAEQPPRVILAVRPSSGSVQGGTPITIVGTGFDPDARVIIGGEPAIDVVVRDSSRITALTPAHAEGPADVVVRNPEVPAAVLADGFAYVPGPTIDMVKPLELSTQGGTRLTIRGTGFRPGLIVTIAGVPASGVSVMSATRATATAPPGFEGEAEIVVANSGQAPATWPRTLIYVAAPEPLPSAAPTPAVPAPAPTSAAPEVPPPAAG